MEPFCQIFASPRDVVRAYIALDNPRLKEIAEVRLQHPIIRLQEFLSEELNIFFWGDVCIMVHSNHMYLYDDGRNYMKLLCNSTSLVLEDAYIQDVQGYNLLWNTLTTFFAEVYVGDTVVEKVGCRTNMWVGNGWVVVDPCCTGVYDGRRFESVAC